jgi:SAM-dependent methyltransferase
MIRDRDSQIRDSWETNAESWTTVVRAGAIASRRVATDAAIVDACAAHLPARVLDVGCGEGWLARALAERGAQVLGLDASAALVELARAAGSATYDVASYESLIADSSVAPGPWELIVCNFSLLGDPLAPTLGALASRLASNGWLLIQTVHPWIAMGDDAAYRDEWRLETFAGFGEHFAASMPWYFRTLGSWVAELGRAGLEVESLAEPCHPETGRPLSLLITAR